MIDFKLGDLSVEVSVFFLLLGRDASVQAGLSDTFLFLSGLGDVEIQFNVLFIVSMDSIFTCSDGSDLSSLSPVDKSGTDDSILLENSNRRNVIWFQFFLYSNKIQICVELLCTRQTTRLYFFIVYYD
jgi:hypothetical protein